MLNFLKSVFNFREQKKQLLSIVLFTFFASFLVARGWSVFVSNAIYVKGYHIHHFYFGTLALVAGGLIALLSESTRKLKLAAVLIGSGMGLFADEMGLLLNCTTSYRECAYAFPDYLDIIGSIGLCIFLIIVIVEIADKAKTKKQP